MERDNSKRRKVSTQRQTRSGRVNTSNDVHKRIILFEQELMKINEQRENEEQSRIKFWYGGGLKKKTGQDVIAFVGTKNELEDFLQSFNVSKYDLHVSVPGEKTKIDIDGGYINKVGFADALQDAYNRSPEFRERLDNMINKTIYPWRGMLINTMSHIGQRYGQSHNFKDIARDFAKKSSGYKGGRRKHSLD